MYVYIYVASILVTGVPSPPIAHWLGVNSKIEELRTTKNWRKSCHLDSLSLISPMLITIQKAGFVWSSKRSQASCVQQLGYSNIWSIVKQYTMKYDVYPPRCTSVDMRGGVGWSPGLLSIHAASTCDHWQTPGVYPCHSVLHIVTLDQVLCGLLNIVKCEYIIQWLVTFPTIHESLLLWTCETYYMFQDCSPW